MKLIIKLLIVALLANGCWHVMSAYLAFYKFKDAVTQTTLFGNDKSIEQLRDRVVNLAAEYDLPIGEDDFSLRRESRRTTVDGTFTRPIELAPGFVRPWEFPFHIETFSDAPVTGDRK